MLHWMKAAPVRKPHFLREWRKHKGLSQRALANLLNDPEFEETVTTDASLSRIENGLQPYTQPLLEALASIYGCAPADLIMRNPLDPEAPWSIWETLKPATKRLAAKIIRDLKDSEAA